MKRPALARLCSLGLLSWSLVGCFQPGGTAEGAATPSVEILRRIALPAAEPNAKVSHVDLDRDGRDEVAVASASGLVVYDVTDAGAVEERFRAPARGGATAIVSGDVDADGFADLVVGWGSHRDHRDAPATLVTYRTGDAAAGRLIEEVVASPPTARAQFTDLRITPLAAGEGAGILYSYFASKYDVASAFARKSNASQGDAQSAASWASEPLQRIRMASSLTLLPRQQGRASFVVGRPYGDEVKSDGDVFVVDPSGARRTIPSLRGVRSLELLELGSSETPIRLLCFGDGWHWRYREEGRGLLTCARLQGAQPGRPKVVAEVPDYALERLVAADLDGDGEREIVAQGSDGLYRFRPTVEGDTLMWSGRRLDAGGYHFDALDVDGDGRSELVTGGERPQLLFFSRP